MERNPEIASGLVRRLRANPMWARWTRVLRRISKTCGGWADTPQTGGWTWRPPCEAGVRYIVSKNDETRKEVPRRATEFAAGAIRARHSGETCQGERHSTTRKAISVKSHAPLSTAAVATFVEVRTRLCRTNITNSTVPAMFAIRE